MGRWAIDHSRGYGLGIDPDGHAALWVGDGTHVDEIRTEITLIPQCWYFITASYDAATQKAELHLINCVSSWNSRSSTVVPFQPDAWVRETLRHAPKATGSDASFQLAAASAQNPIRGHHAALLFNGTIDRSGVFTCPLPRAEIAALAKGTPPDPNALLAYRNPTTNLMPNGVGDLLPNAGPHDLHLHGTNRPARSMTRSNGRSKAGYRLAPETFGGVSYHDDAMTDCQRERSFAQTLPDDLKSGVCCLRIDGDDAGYDFDLITDHDLHAKGLACLAPYKTVLKGTHPDCYSEDMMDATEAYLTSGGRVMYLGGNGYYWVTGTRADAPHCIEVRKLDAGSRAWQADPGEGYLASTGQKSGLWRSRGRAPQKIVGLGFTAEGMDESQPFKRMPDRFHKRVAWIFDGIGDEALIGAFGLAGGGVALDRYDLAHGTPPQTLLIAATSGHFDSYPMVSEEVTYAFPGLGDTQDAPVRGDMIYFAPQPWRGLCRRVDRVEPAPALSRWRKYRGTHHAQRVESLPDA